jgi:hypothetical protein
MNILLYTFCSQTARTWLDRKNKGLFGILRGGPPPGTINFYGSSSTYISVLSALKWQASLSLSLNSQIKVESVKNTIFEVFLPHRKDLNAIGAI